MHPLYDEFLTYLEEQNKEKCVDFALSKLAGGEVDVGTLYIEILTPSLNEGFCKIDQLEICIWEEHLRSSIVRTIIEACYPYVIRERRAKFPSGSRGTVLVVCPPEELHELGARMAADLFTLGGFDATFVGANTPQEEILGAVGHLKPAYVAISTTSSYNLVAAKKTIQRLLDIRQEKGLDFKVIVGGHAFDCNPCFHEEAGADIYLPNLRDILGFAEER
jgi:methanogenic corrinoid protein MtbC1